MPSKWLVEEIKEAALKFHASSLSEEETADLRYAYLVAVKKLHPDINPGLSKSAVDLWNQIQKSYAEKDWTNVKFLVSLVDGVISGGTEFSPSPDGMAGLRDSCERLEVKSQEVARELERMKSVVPFSYEGLLGDKELLGQRQAQLNAQIAALEDCIEEYERLWKDGK